MALRALQADLQAERAKDARDPLRVNQLLATLKSLQIREEGRIFIATRTNLREQGETPTKYFFELLACKENTHAITAIQTSEGRVLRDQENIIGECINILYKFD